MSDDEKLRIESEEQTSRSQRTTEDIERAEDRVAEDAATEVRKARDQVTRVRVRPQGKLHKLGWFPYQTALASLLVFAGVTDLIAPEVAEIPVGQPLWIGPLVASLFVVAGVLQLYGLGRSLSRIEIVGHALLVTALLTSTTAVLLYGDRPLQAEIVLLIFGWAAAVRIYELLRGRFLVQVERDDE